jgi:hypothetical protein
MTALSCADVKVPTRRFCNTICMLTTASTLCRCECNRHLRNASLHETTVTALALSAVTLETTAAMMTHMSSIAAATTWTLMALLICHIVVVLEVSIQIISHHAVKRLHGARFYYAISYHQAIFNVISAAVIQYCYEQYTMAACHNLILSVLLWSTLWTSA